MIEDSLHDTTDILVPVDISLGVPQTLPVLLNGDHEALAHVCPPVPLRLNRGDDQPRGALSQLAVAQTIVRPRSPDLPLPKSDFDRGLPVSYRYDPGNATSLIGEQNIVGFAGIRRGGAGIFEGELRVLMEIGR